MDVVVATPAATAPSAASLIPTYNPQLFLEYIVEVLKVTLGARDRDIQSNGSLLSPSRKGEALEKCRRFVTSSEMSQCAIYVIKETLETEEPPSDTAGKSPCMDIVWSDRI